jgi:hypothetical protein
MLKFFAINVAVSSFESASARAPECEQKRHQDDNNSGGNSQLVSAQHSGFRMVFQGSRIAICCTALVGYSTRTVK